MIDRYSLIVLILCLLLFVSIINQCWLLKNVYYSKSGIHKINYIDDNFGRWQNINVKTFSYIYPKHVNLDRCYTNDCKDDLIDQRLQAFHKEISEFNNVHVLYNQFNVAPISLSVNDQNIISSLNNYKK